MTNSFCGFLSNGLFISDKIDGNLSFSPCCLYGEYSKKIHYDKWNNVNDWSSYCNNCYIKEKNNKLSHRQQNNKYFKNNDEGITYLELDYSNACNAACGMCNSISSSKIARILKLEGNNNVNVPSVKRKTFFDTITDLDLSKLKILKFKGGEPFYSNFHKDMIKKIKVPHESVLMYQTNGSIYPDQEWWDLVKDFKEVYFSFSIDGINEKFNYIRSDLKFDIVESNIIKILLNSNIKVTGSIEATINPLNAYYYDEIFDFYLKLKKINKSMSFNWHQCWNDWGLENTPPQLRELVNKKYKNINLCKVINELEFDKSKFISFIHSLQKHEKRFNFDANKTFPEVYPLIMEEYEKLITF